MLVRIAAASSLAIALTVGGCTQMDGNMSAAVGSAKLTYADGRPAGTATLLRSSQRLELRISVAGMTPGTHGFHLHSVGQCQPPDFKSAGGHLNPGGNSHGKNSANPAHLGDLPNLVVGPNGKAAAQVPISGTAAADLADIFDRDGTAIVIHADADDYHSDPAGNAGARIACGVLKAAGG